MKNNMSSNTYTWVVIFCKNTTDAKEQFILKCITTQDLLIWVAIPKFQLRAIYVIIKISMLTKTYNSVECKIGFAPEFVQQMLLLRCLIELALISDALLNFNATFIYWGARTASLRFNQSIGLWSLGFWNAIFSITAIKTFKNLKYLVSDVISANYLIALERNLLFSSAFILGFKNIPYRQLHAKTKIIKYVDL